MARSPRRMTLICGGVNAAKRQEEDAADGEGKAPTTTAYRMKWW